MRIGSRSSINRLIVLAGISVLLLCWGFSPFEVSTKFVTTIVTFLLLVILMLWGSRRARRNDSTIRLDNLPESSFAQPLILVCGDGLDTLFGDTAVRVTPLGCYIKVDPTQPLSVFIDAVLSQRPNWLRQLAVLYSVCPEKHSDEAVFRADIKNWRQQFYRLQKRVGYRIPMLVSCWLNGPVSPWFVASADGKMVVREDDESAILLAEWLSIPGIEAQSLRSTMVPGLDAACSWIRNVLLEEMQLPETQSAPIRPVAVGVRFLPLVGVADNLWSIDLQRRTTLDALVPVAADTELSLPFPDPLLPLLSGATRHIRAGLAPVFSIVILMCFAIAAIGCVVNNNQRMISRISLDLTRYLAIPMQSYEPKSQAIMVLKQDAQLLERFHRHGEPLRLGLGLYQGERLWLALQTEIDRYVPPPLPVEETAQEPTAPAEAPKTVRLDSLSLFDVGKFQLKPNSTKMLVNALIDIKAKPGWLIVVAGHTDITGNAQANQTLSLKRAEALRDWMLSTSDVSPTCFAVQGYGATRPIASNDTPEGRALNRRVEISLVPQANACLAAAPQPSSGSDEGLTTSKEK